MQIGETKTAQDGTVTRRSFCMGLSVRGALNWSKRETRKNMKWMTWDGKPFLTPEALRQCLMDELAQGHEIIPYGKCDNWDWKNGCQGHES